MVLLNLFFFLSFATYFKWICPVPEKSLRKGKIHGIIYLVHFYLNFSRCLELCRAWNKNHQVRWTLYLPFGDIRTSAKLLIPVGRVFCYQVRDLVCLPLPGCSDNLKYQKLWCQVTVCKVKSRNKLNDFFEDFSVIKGRRRNVEIVTNVKCVLNLKNISLLPWQLVSPKSCGVFQRLTIDARFISDLLFSVWNLFGFSTFRKWR